MTPLHLFFRFSFYYFQSFLVVLALTLVNENLNPSIAVVYLLVALASQAIVFVAASSQRVSESADPQLVLLQAFGNMALQIGFIFLVPELFYYFVGTLFVVCTFSATRLTRQQMLLILIVSIVFVCLAVVSLPVQMPPIDTIPQKLVTAAACGMLLWCTSAIAIEASTIRRRLDTSTERLKQMIRIMFDKDTELKRHREELETLVAERTAELSAAKEEAENANLAKSQFLANISHELRTPLNGILGAGEVLQGTIAEPEEKALATVVVASGHSLLRLVNDLLDYSTLQSDGVTIQTASFDLRELLESTLEMSERDVADRPIELMFRWPDGLASEVIGDGGRIRQIVANLLNNAVRFTDSGSVRIDVEGPVQGSLDWQISVHDTGVGIPPEKLDEVFDAFRQVDDSSSRKYGGTGLGLAISRELARRMHGDLIATNSSSEGSRLTLLIPLNPASEVSTGASERAFVPIQLPGTPSILLVEDNDANQLVAVRMLTMMGCKTTVASSGKSALELLEEHTFNIALIDCQMPVMDGLELTQKIRSLEAGRDTRLPVIAVTAHARESDQERCMEAGMDDFLSKPYSMLALQTKLSHWLARSV